ncbi:MAG: alpha/beta fold hydrolase [Isosphaeraceae bacterium]|nr:alpha/beta fold hydrolase [Isosphaeraceae bacterium]
MLSLPTRPSRPDLRAGLHRRLVALVAGVFLLAPLGCAGISARESVLRNMVTDWRQRAETSRTLSATSGALLEELGLVELAANNPAAAARALEGRLNERPDENGPLALAELSLQAGVEHPAGSPAALGWFRDAAALASMALAKPAGAAPDVAVAVHNQAVARLLRTGLEVGRAGGRPWHDVLGEQGLALGTTAPYLDPAYIADLRVADDLVVTGMDHVYRCGGLGVPIVANRVTGQSAGDDPRDRFLPHELRAAATAVVVADGGFDGGEWRRRPASLLFFDPFERSSLTLGVNDVVLAGDRTTPLASQVSSGQLQTLELMGLLDPGFRRPGTETGLYMLRPYEPGKIPLVFVHGLVSSPRAWAQTINELRNCAALADRYQLWVFLYPTGLPIPGSAAQLREALTQVRDHVDPAHSDPAMDRMVLVGHSMGGILSKMMTQETGLNLWNATITVPHDRFAGPPELRQGLDSALVFRPLPFVKRVVFIASPHRGSPLANDLLGRVVSGLVRSPDEMAAREAEIETFNGPGVISPDLRGRRLNAIGNLRTDSPVLLALDQIPIDPGVPFHSIIPQIGGVKGSDGVVEYRSSHLDGAVSEKIVTGTHFSQGRPEVTAELRRILLEHLEVEGPPLVAGGG